jgi:hypothetical protein
MWGKELADQLAKQAASSNDINECYKTIKNYSVLSDLNECSVTKWPSEWNNTTKGAITKPFFPKIAERLKLKINVTQNFTTMVTGHGNIKSYLHKYKILDSPTCSCKSGEQTVDPILFNCKLRQQERDRQKVAVLWSQKWPVSKNSLITKFNRTLRNSRTVYRLKNYRQQ